MKILAVLAIGVLATAANAFTFTVNGVWYGTICRSGIYYTSYPAQMAQPVGTICPIRDAYGNVIGTGQVTVE